MAWCFIPDILFMLEVVVINQVEIFLAPQILLKNWVCGKMKTWG